jgi:hypothetical protein
MPRKDETELSQIPLLVPPLPDTSYKAACPSTRIEPYVFVASGLDPWVLTCTNIGLNYCFTHPELISGIREGALMVAGINAFAMGASFVGCACAINWCVLNSEDPKTKKIGMCAADTCLVAGCLTLLTPLGPMAGAAIARETSMAAMKTTAVSSAITTAAITLGTGALFFSNAHNRSQCRETPSPVTLRSEQYRQVNEVIQQRQARSAVMN